MALGWLLQQDKGHPMHLPVALLQGMPHLGDCLLGERDADEVQDSMGCVI